MVLKNLITAFAIIFAVAGTTHAAHPLITDDTGTQGKGKLQLEFDGEYGNDNEDGITTNTFIFPTTPVISYGIVDTVDLILGVPFEWRETKQNGIATTARGISDASIQLKWRFHKKDGLSFAVKPGIALPTGDEDKGLGNGKVSYSTFLITTKEIAPWAFHMNLGYIRNEYKLRSDEDTNRKDIWHVSFAVEAEVVNSLRIVANIGMERNPDKTSNAEPAFVLGGLIYSVSENLDVDFGIKYGLNRPETDTTYLAGITWRL
jgi:hypothetical protein